MSLRSKIFGLVACICTLRSAACCLSADIEISGYPLETRYGLIDFERDRESGTNRLLINHLDIHPYWSLRKEEQGWVVFYTEIKQSTHETRGPCEWSVAYLSYRTRAPENANESTSLVYLSEKLDDNRYWKIDVEDARPIVDTTLFVRPLRGEFADWYLSPGERTGIPPRELTLRRLKDWVQIYKSGYSHRTVKGPRGCLNIDEIDQRITFQVNPSAFIGIWNVRQGQHGWLICREPDSRKPNMKPAYLSYRQKKVEKVEGENEKPVNLIYLSETPAINSYWQVDTTKPIRRDFQCQIRPMCGEFEGWYLTEGQDLSDKKTPEWKKKLAATLVRELPAEPIQMLLDGP